jgi:hypothetical protein
VEELDQAALMDAHDARAQRKRIGLVMPPAAASDLPIQIEHLP